MSEPSSPIDWVKYRARIEFEDGLLNERVNVFLVLNGLGAGALGLSKEYTVQIMIAIVVIAVNLLLWLCTFQTVLVIRNLTSEYILSANDPIDDRVRQTMKRWPRKIRPTYILGVWLPLVLLLGWLVGLILLIVTVCRQSSSA